ncbi:hypothetical protein ACFQX6_31700 [Streptosporangium lutulentum]
MELGGESLRGLEEVDAGLREARAHGQAATVHMWSMCRARILLDAGSWPTPAPRPRRRSPWSRTWDRGTPPT